MAKKRVDTLLAARHGGDATWHGTAFVVEALLLLLFLAFALAVFMQLFGTAHARGAEERQLTQAVLLASNAAEEFAAAPHEGTTSEMFDGDGDALDMAAEAGADEAADAYVVACEVVPERTEGGTLYHASITVTYGDQVVYELESSRYASDGATARKPFAGAADGATPAKVGADEAAAEEGTADAEGGDAV